MLDESSLASTRQMRDFLNTIRPHDRALVSRDTRQPFEHMQDAGMKTALLDRIMRQQDPALLLAVERLAKNEIREGIAMLCAQGRITEIADKQTCHKKLSHRLQAGAQS